MTTINANKLKSAEHALCSPHCSAMWSKLASRGEHLSETKEAEWGGSMRDCGWWWWGCGGGGVVGSSVRCLSGLPACLPATLTDGLFYVCVCARPCLCVSMYPSVPLTQKHPWRRETHSNKPLIFMAMPRAVLLMSCSVFLRVAVLSAAVLADGACIKSLPCCLY